MPCGQRMEAAKFLFSLFCFSLFQGLHLPPQSLSYLEPGMAPLWGDLPLGLCSGRSDRSGLRPSLLCSALALDADPSGCISTGGAIREQREGAVTESLPGPLLVWGQVSH